MVVVVVVVIRSQLDKTSVHPTLEVGRAVAVRISVVYGKSSGTYLSTLCTAS